MSSMLKTFCKSALLTIQLLQRVTPYLSDVGLTCPHVIGLHLIDVVSYIINDKESPQTIRLMHNTGMLHFSTEEISLHQRSCKTLTRFKYWLIFFSNCDVLTDNAILCFSIFTAAVYRQYTHLCVSVVRPCDDTFIYSFISLSTAIIIHR